MRIDSTLHPIVCGRSRKHIKVIESATNTAIYFPPFAAMSQYCPPEAHRRPPDEIYITGENPQGIELAKRKIHDLVNRTKLFMKDALVSPAKIDSIILGRMDKVRKIMDSNGTYVMFPPLASQRNMIRVQGIEGLQIERTMKEIMTLVRPITPMLNSTCAELDQLTDCRLVNSTMLLGGSNPEGSFSHPRLLRFGPCSAICVHNLERTSHLTR